MRNKIAHALPVFAVVMAAVAAEAIERHTGHVNLHMSGGSAPNVTGVLVTVQEVEAHVNNRWVELSSTPTQVDLMDAASVPALLASADVPAGHYTQLRLRMSDAQVQDANGWHPALMPSGKVHVKLNFRVAQGQTLNLLLAFDVGESLVRRGNATSSRYLLKPVLRAGTEATVGTVTGWTSDGASVLAGASVDAVYVSGGAQPPGTVVASVLSGADGRFNLGALPSGTYEFRFRFVRSSGQVLQAVWSVAIAAGMNTDLGEVVLF